MKLSYYKSLGRKLAVVSIVCLSAMTYQGEVLARAHSGSNGNGGHGNGNGQGWGNDLLGLRSDLIGAENASNMAREHAAHNSAVILVDPDHYDVNGVHREISH